MTKKILFIMALISGALFTNISFAQDSGAIIEWAPFVVADGVDDEELLAASEQLQKGFLENQKGFLKRELLKGKDNHWVDLVYWASEEDAQQAMENAATSPVCMTYFSLMVAADHTDPSAGVFHYRKMADWK